MNIVKCVACACVGIVATVIALQGDTFMAFVVLAIGLYIIFD